MTDQVIIDRKKLERLEQDAAALAKNQVSIVKIEHFNLFSGPKVSVEYYGSDDRMNILVKDFSSTASELADLKSRDFFGRLKFLFTKE